MWFPYKYTSVFLFRISPANACPSLTSHVSSLSDWFLAQWMQTLTKDCMVINRKNSYSSWFLHIMLNSLEPEKSAAYYDSNHEDRLWDSILRHVLVRIVGRWQNNLSDIVIFDKFPHLAKEDFPWCVRGKLPIYWWKTSHVLCVTYRWYSCMRRFDGMVSKI